MQPAPAAAKWNVPAIESVEALADWLALTPDDLACSPISADSRIAPTARGLPTTATVKRSGGGRPRLIEAPKRTLKLLQRQVLGRILEPIPPHPSAHSFLRGRSTKTFVAPHVAQRVVLRMDLQDFFPTITRARVQALFRTLGYPEPVADLLGGLCSNATPRHAWNDAPPGIDHRLAIEARALHAPPHLPQGAPTSPALANLCAWRLDCRLAGFAASTGAIYTRYADDLAFSGDAEFERRAERFAAHAAAIVAEEGFAVNHRKTRVMRQGVRQQLAGLVTNQHANVPRAEFDRLKAILTNCARSGCETQNHDGHPSFYAHLAGRVSYFESINPTKARRLRAIFDQIVNPS